MDEIEVLRHAVLVLAGESAQLKVFLHAHLGEDATSFGHLRDAVLDDLVRGRAGDVLAEEGDGAALGREQPGYRAQRRGLSRAVRADERDDLALSDFEAHAFERVDRAVVDVDVVDFQHSFCHLYASPPR